ncbi:unnamed protein product, partial [Mesorhabditis belari]|uniref:Gustatory receptor n=1 Tax=Mesorhabditis belari TaxID=2138241 RepID=A0AAF3EU61_9BILA
MVYGDKIITVYYRPDLVFLLSLLQCFLNVLLVFWIRLYLKILCKSSACHPNLLVLLSSQPLIHLVALTAKTIRFLAECAGLITTPFLTAINFISDIGLSATCVIVLGYCIERIVAMRNIESYELMFRPIPWLGIGILATSLVYATVLLSLWYQQILKSRVIYVAQIGLFSCSGLFFIGIKINANRAYERMAKYRYSSVNQRYQTAMNFKAAKLLLYLAPYKCISSLLILVSYAFVYDRTKDQLLPLYTEFFFLYNYAQVSLQILLVLLCHSTLRRLLFETLAIEKVRKRKVSDLCVRSVTGSRLQFPSNDATDLYFATLNKAWEFHDSMKSQIEQTEIPKKQSIASRPHNEDIYKV